MTDYRIVPSILSADFTRLGEEVAEVIRAGMGLIYFNVMDSHYVPNLAFGLMVCAALKSYATVSIDVHLMVEPVNDLIHAFAKAGANIIAFHPKANHHINRSLGLTKEYGCQVGLVLSPAAPVNILENILDKLDMVLLMSVNPGFDGQSFTPNTLVKIHKVREMLDEYKWQDGRHIALEVDGDVKTDNIAEIATASTDTFVADSAIFGKLDYKAVIDEVRQQLAQIG